VADDQVPADPELEAGDFAAWLTEVQASIKGQGASTVPCAGCTACCTSFQFVHIGPDESDTLAHIPAELLVPAPGLPPGHAVLGYDQRGHCPMLIDQQCSIYEHRPKTCRTYDCRVLPAAGIELQGRRTAGIARRVRRWKFSFPDRSDAAEFEAIRSAGAFLMSHRDRLADQVGPITDTQLAVLAIEVHELFLRRATDTADAQPVTPAPEAVYDEIKRRTGRRPSP
jgi:hypothetical protein